uniref:Probable oligoribonuclease n=1 Tax=Xenopsylla cheopis TaxID=163159 RepID=A0A6M2DCW0_XENCH
MSILLHRFKQLAYTMALNKNMAKAKFSTQKRIVWMDLEMTGLDVDKDKILEIACVVTESDLKIVDTCSTLVIHQPDEVLSNMNEWCMVNHARTGLIDDCKKSTLTLDQAQNILIDFLKKNVPQKECPLAGNSIYMDRLFLMKHMPVVNEYLHYRIIDVSSIKELCKRWNNNFFKKAPKKELLHRAQEDILESIKELQYYKTLFHH